MSSCYCCRSGENEIFRRMKRNSVISSTREVCRTIYHTTGDSQRFRHEATNHVVSLYLYRGSKNSSCSNCRFYQQFQVGTCNRISNPLVRVVLFSAYSFTCQQTQTSVLATIMVTRGAIETGQYNNCYQVDDSLYLCRDWVTYSSQCKLFYSPRET